MLTEPVQLMVLQAQGLQTVQQEVVLQRVQQAEQAEQVPVLTTQP